MNLWAEDFWNCKNGWPGILISFVLYVSFFFFFFLPLIDSRVQKEITLFQTILQHKYKDVILKDGQEINFKISIIEFLVEDFR